MNNGYSFSATNMFTSSALVCGLSGRNEHHANANACLECSNCGLSVGRHVELLHLQVPAVQLCMDGLSSATASVLRQQAVGAMAIGQHALQQAVLLRHGFPGAEDSRPDFVDLYELRTRVSTVVNSLLAVEALVQSQMDSIALDDVRHDNSSGAFVNRDAANGVIIGEIASPHNIVIIDD